MGGDEEPGGGQMGGGDIEPGGGQMGGDVEPGGGQTGGGDVEPCGGQTGGGDVEPGGGQTGGSDVEPGGGQTGGSDVEPGGGQVESQVGWSRELSDGRLKPEDTRPMPTDASRDNARSSGVWFCSSGERAGPVWDAGGRLCQCLCSLPARVPRLVGCLCRIPSS